MKKISTLLICALLGYVAPYGIEAAQVQWETNVDAGIQKAQKVSKPTLILFTGSDWCTWCVRLEQEVLNQPAFAQAMQDRVVFVKADFPDPSEAAIMRSPNKAAMDRYGVEAFPTFVAVDAQGRKLFTMGYLKGGPDNYAREIQNRLKAAGQ